MRKKNSPWQLRLLQIGFTLLGVGIALIPSGIFVVSWQLLDPVGFWQRLVMIGGGITILGGVQVGLLILLIPWLITVWE